jgi:hypothetical protein
MKQNFFVIFIAHAVVFIAFVLLIKEVPSTLLFSSSTLQLHITDLIHNDAVVPLQLVRLFHNKGVVFLFDFLNRYLAYANPLFIADTLGIVGLVGFFLGLYYFFLQKNKSFFSIFLLSYIILLPLCRVFLLLSSPFFLLPYYIFSGWGYYSTKESSSKKMFFVLLFLVILSIIWFLFAKNKFSYLQSFDYI